MKKIILMVILLFVTKSIQSQVINAESLRMVNDTTGWAGSVRLNFGFSKNVTEVINLKNKIHVQYKAKKHLIMFINKISFEKAADAEFVNKGVQHLRYNYRMKPKLALELFLQNQYNEISKIDFRELAGAGFRYKLSKSEKYKVYLGSLIMHEYEKELNDLRTTNRDWRNSSYMSFSFYFNKQISLISTTYYQPKLTDFSDFRISHQSALNITIVKNLAFNLAFNYTYDAFPVIGIPKTAYDITNGIVYKFK